MVIKTMSQFYDIIPKKSQEKLNREKLERVRFSRPCTRCGNDFKTTRYGTVCDNCRGQTPEKILGKRKD